MEIVQLPPPCRLSDSELLATLDTVDAALSELQAYYWQASADLEARNLAKELGARDTTEFLSMRHRRDARKIRRDLKLAKELPKYEAVAAALASAHAGLSPAHAKTIIATLEKAPSTVPADDLRVAEEQMIEAAQLLTPLELRAFGREVLDRLDTDGREPTDDDPYRQETLWLKPIDGGVKFGGHLIAENAELLKTAIYDLAKPHKTVEGERDPRSRDRRQATALTTILEIATGATATPGVPGVPHLTVTIDFADLQTATSHAVGELVFGDNLSAAAVRVLACDAAVLPIVLGTDSQPLDLGTEQRFVSRPIRRALNKRDKGCVICHAPPSNCHAHHITHWANGGPTSLTNLVLLCAAHHRAVHADHWTITITNGLVHVTRPAWTNPIPTSPTTLIHHTLQHHSPPTVRTNPHHEHPHRLRPTPLPSSTAPTEGLSWLTPQAAAHLNPWRESGTPSAGP